ncbi:hypothetical protein [Methanobacterium sp. SMA-27]|uniref:hypothetical protein n=1 Tax=Methanobacterium sp. SMA-27 TaxID=1495336 RepID=UPI00064E19AF|nr:hypothetical protein [Methanobacterium sp. SMA-27]
MLDHNDEEYKELDEDNTENSTEELNDDSSQDSTEELNKDSTEENEEELDADLEEEFDEEGEEDEGEDLPFAKAEVVRLMKRNLDKDKMIRERVKVEMNKFLGEVLERVCEQLNDYPYTTIEYEMLKESIYPYTNIKRINEEKFRILKHLEAIKADCDALTMDVKKSLKLKDIDDESDEIF